MSQGRKEKGKKPLPEKKLTGFGFLAAIFKACQKEAGAAGRAGAGPQCPVAVTEEGVPAAWDFVLLAVLPSARPSGKGHRKKHTGQRCFAVWLREPGTARPEVVGPASERAYCSPALQIMIDQTLRKRCLKISDKSCRQYPHLRSERDVGRRNPDGRGKWSPPGVTLGEAGQGPGLGGTGMAARQGCAGQDGGQVRENKLVLRPKDTLWKPCGVFGRGTPGLGAGRGA